MQLHNALVREYNLLRAHCVGARHEFKSVIGLKAVRQNDLGGFDLAHGTVEFMSLVFGGRTPCIDCYPVELRPFLNREIVQTRLGDVPECFEGFIKPIKTKLWTGFVTNGSDDLRRLAPFGKRTPVWLSERVGWLTEWRYYVIDGLIRASACYEGDESIEPDITVVETAIRRMSSRPAAFCLDFGVLCDDNVTALIEVNDGWSLGWYPEDQVDVYFELLLTRFREIMECAQSNT